MRKSLPDFTALVNQSLRLNCTFDIVLLRWLCALERVKELYSNFTHEELISFEERKTPALESWCLSCKFYCFRDLLQRKYQPSRGLNKVNHNNIICVYISVHKINISVNKKIAREKAARYYEPPGCCGGPIRTIKALTPPVDFHFVIPEHGAPPF